MNLSSSVLGASAVTRLNTLSGEHVLTIGSDKLTRRELAAVGCYNFVAARFLTAALQDFHIKSLRDVYDRIPPRDLALPRVGVISLAVLGAAFEAKHIGGSNPLEAWVRKHQPKIVTFDTIKHQAEKAEREGKRKSKRDAARRRRAQEQREHEAQVARVIDQAADDRR